MKSKKIIMSIISVFLILSSVMGTAGCTKKIKESGDFLYSVRTEDNQYQGTVYLEGLSKSGKEKEIVIVPKTIEGRPVTKLTYEYGWSFFNGKLEGALNSERLKAIYIIPKVEIWSFEEAFERCSNLSKVVIVNVDGFDGHIMTVRNQATYPGFVKVYFCRGYFKGGGLRPVGCYANVSYLYNYEGAENRGYYWVDNFDYGEKIGYVPENPEREGYVFGGWYKEPECVTVWDFNTDTLPEAKYAEETGSYEDEEWHREEWYEEGEELYQETRLYAKWNKN